MDLILAVVVYPVLLFGLTLGTGLIVERVSAWRLPLALLPALGAAALIGLTQLTTSFGSTAAATPWIVLGVAVAGLLLGRARLVEIVRAGGETWWPLLALAAAFAVAIAPVALSGSVTLASYLLDTTSSIQLLGAEKITEHGRHFDASALTASNEYLKFYFGLGYPAGSHTLLGATGHLVPIRLIWLYQPFLAFMQALAAPVLWLLARRIFGFGRGVSAAVATVAAVPALVFAYQLMGSIKEIVALPIILLLWALVIDTRAWLRASPRAVIPVALAAAAGVGAIGLAFGAWILAAGVAVIVLALLDRRRLTLKGVALRVGVIAFVGVIASYQTVQDLSHTTGLAKSLSQSNQTLAADPGNLLRPLRAIQVLGIWIGGDHRVDPDQLTPTYLLLGIALFGVLAGFAYLVRRGFWTPFAVFVLSAVIWWVLTKRGTTWTDAKMIVLSSPLAVLLALGGLGTLVPGRRLEAVLLVAAVGVGVLWSDAVLYHDRNLAPAKRFDELASINTRFAGHGPALFTDFDEYAMLLANDLAPDQPGFAHHSTLTVDRKPAGLSAPYGATLDLDQIDWHLVEQFPLIVQRRSPEQSRPPANYVRAWQGTWYDVWRRQPAPKVLDQLGAYRDGSASAPIKCADIRRLAGEATSRGAQLAYAKPSPVVQVNPQKASRSPNWQGAIGPTGIGLGGPGQLQATVRVPRGGPWLLWLGGDISRPVTVYVNGRAVGVRGRESGGDRNYLKPIALTLSAGVQHIRIVRGGGSLRPGDAAPSVLRRIALQQPLSPSGAVVNLPPANWRGLCHRPLDWVAVVSGV